MVYAAVARVSRQINARGFLHPEFSVGIRIVGMALAALAKVRDVIVVETEPENVGASVFGGRQRHKDSRIIP
jgi:hypothetical protein